MSESAYITSMIEIKQFITPPIHTNCYLIHNKETHEGVIVDAGFDLLEQIEWYLSDWDITLKAVLLTHSHWDHIGGLKAIQEKYDVPTYVHAHDAVNVTQPGSDGMAAPQDIEPAVVSHFLEDKQVLNLAGASITVIETPGHSPGSLCFYLEKEQVLFSGDTLFEGTCGNISFPHSSPQSMVTSLNRLAQLPKDTIVYPGHGELTSLFDEDWIAQAGNILR